MRNRIYFILLAYLIIIYTSNLVYASNPDNCCYSNAGQEKLGPIGIFQPTGSPIFYKNHCIGVQPISQTFSKNAIDLDLKICPCGGTLSTVTDDVETYRWRLFQKNSDGNWVNQSKDGSGDTYNYESPWYANSPLQPYMLVLLGKDKGKFGVNSQDFIYYDSLPSYIPSSDSGYKIVYSEEFNVVLPDSETSSIVSTVSAQALGAGLYGKYDFYKVTVHHSSGVSFEGNAVTELISVLSTSCTPYLFEFGGNPSIDSTNTLVKPDKIGRASDTDETNCKTFYEQDMKMNYQIYVKNHITFTVGTDGFNNMQTNRIQFSP